MSEEMKQKAIEFEEKYFERPFKAIGVMNPILVPELMAEFATQFWEQREKEHGHTLKQRAEAAELALQTVKGLLFQEQQSHQAAENALQAKEQEVPQLKELLKGLREACETCLTGASDDSLSPRYWLNRIIGLENARHESLGCEKKSEREAELAQARQQAVAPFSAELVHVAAKLMRGEYVLNLENAGDIREARRRVDTQDRQHKDEGIRIKNRVDELRSLTPPPAPNKEK